MNTKNDPLPRDRRSHASRLTVELPRDTMTALKIHAAASETTIRNVVTTLVTDAVQGGAA